jgi:hypothetical protein
LSYGRAVPAGARHSQGDNVAFASLYWITLAVGRYFQLEAMLRLTRGKAAAK